MTRSRTLTVLTLVGLLAGCEQIQQLQPPEPPPKPLPRLTIGFGRVAVVEFYNRTAYPHSAMQFTEQLREKLAEWTVAADVVIVPQSELPDMGDPFMGGRVPLDTIVEVRRKYRADAVVIGSLDSHNPYWKPSVHVSVKMIDTSTATVPFELSESWDATQGQVERDIADYYERNRGRDDCRFGPNLFVTSPSYFMRFVADRIAERITESV
jgi:hypothetical protein